MTSERARELAREFVDSDPWQENVGADHKAIYEKEIEMLAGLIADTERRIRAEADALVAAVLLKLPSAALDMLIADKVKEAVEKAADAEADRIALAIDQAIELPDSSGCESGDVAECLISAIKQGIDQAVEKEREACAVIADEWTSYLAIRGMGNLAAAIRERR